MSDAKASFAVELKDDTSPAALSAAEALQKMRGAIDRDVKALAEMQAAMKRVQGAGSVNIQVFKELQAKIEAQKTKIAEAQGKYVSLGGTFGGFHPKAKSAGDAVAGLGDRIKKVPGPIGDMSRKLGDLREAMGGARLSTILIGGAFLAVGALAVAGIAKLFAYAVNSSAALKSAATRAGGPVMSLSRQMTAMKRDFAKLFSGLNLGPFLRGLRSITSMFSANTATGHAFKTLLTGLLQPLLDGAGAAFPIFKRFFQGMLIAVLQLRIGYLRIKIALLEAFGPRVLGGIDGAKIALNAGKIAVYGLAAAMAVLAVNTLIAAAPFLLIVGGIALALYGFYRFGRVARRTWEEFKVQWQNGGSQLVDGLIAGIRRGVDRAKEAVKGLGRDIINEWRSILDIHSPSRVFADLGVQIPAGVEQGVNRGASSLDRTVANMLDVPTVVAGPSGSAASPARGGQTVTFTFGDIIVQGAEGTRAAARAFVDEVAELLEGVTIGMGVPS